MAWRRKGTGRRVTGHRILLAAWTAWLLTACASMAGTRQVLSVDSPERGIEVLDARGRPLGRTPLFVRVEREPGHLLHLRRPGAGHTERFVLDCRYRPAASLLANTTVGLLGLGGGPLLAAAFFAGANGLDLLTGAAFDCPEQVMLPARPAGTVDLPGDATPACPVFVIAPPRHEDGQVARLLADRWWQRQQARQPCAQRVEPARSDPVFRRQGVTHETGLKLRSYGRTLRNELGLRTRASHLVVLTAVTRSDTIDAVPTVYDLHSLAAVGGEPLHVDLAREERAPRHPVASWLGRHVQLLPDGVGFALADKKFHFEATAGATVVDDVAAPSSLPGVVSNWTLLSADHPSAHGAWDLTLRLAPELLAGYGARVLTLDPGDGTRQKATVEMLHAGALYGLSGAVHTPAGAFSANLGLGIAGAWHWHGGRYQRSTGALYAGAGVAWTVFVTEDLFLRLAVGSYATGAPHVRGPGYALRQWTTTSLTFGWYVPEWRAWVRGLF